MILLDQQRLEHARQHARESAQSSLHPALERLRADAVAALTAGPWAVTDRAQTAPSGDPHDYYTVGPYWWPDPQSLDGLPYIRRDGETNPDYDAYDSPRIRTMANTVETLALAWFYLGDEHCARRAGMVLRRWFLDDATRMNPHLEYSQAIPGICTGRGIGIIETTKIRRLPDAVALLAGAPGWTRADEQAMRGWFSKFVAWLRESPHGKMEAGEHNNHGTWYDAQLAVFSLFAGEPEIAREALATVLERRIATQIEPDGRQPHELLRTRSYSYSIYNLSAFFIDALAGEKVGLDLWHSRTPDGRGLRVALEWLLPYVAGERPWQHQHIIEISNDEAAVLLRIGAIKYPGLGCERAFACLSRLDPALDPASARANLLYPPSA